MSGDLLTGLWFRTAAPAWSPREWEDALGQARQCRLLGRMAAHFADQGWMTQVPAGPAKYLQSALHAADRQRREVIWEIDRIEAALSDVDTPVVALKGAAYVLSGLPAARGRLFSDIDIMVARHRLDDAERALFGAGWIPEQHDAYDDRYYREWMHELPPLRHVQRGTFVDMHHTIAPPTSRYRVDGQRLLERVRPLTPGGRLCVLAPEDMVLHSAVHLMQEGEFGAGLRDLLDMTELLRHFSQSPEFGTTLLARAQELKLDGALAQVLVQLQRLGGLDLSAPALRCLQGLLPSGMRGAMLSSALTVALRPAHPSCDTAWTAVARSVLYVRSHCVRMPLHQVVPHLVRKAWIRRLPRDT
jgi:hypothetical protein